MEVSILVSLSLLSCSEAETDSYVEGTLQGIEMTIYAPGSVFDRATNYPEFVDGRFNITSRTNSTKMSSLIANLNADDAANLTSVA